MAKPSSIAATRRVRPPDSAVLRRSFVRSQPSLEPSGQIEEHDARQDYEADRAIHPRKIVTLGELVDQLPEAAEVDIDIAEDDLKIDTLRSGGAGGQHVNKTESAVRMTHIPTGIVVMMQEDRSQHRNRAKAMAILRARLYDYERQRQDAARAAERRGQVGSGDRSERIRTYNFPQGRVSDHRIDLTLYKLPQVIEGEALGEIIEALMTEHQAELLAAEGS